MAQNRSIDSVIKKVTSSYKLKRSDEEIFTVHRNRLEIVNNPWPWQRVEYYLVSFSSFAECNNLTYRVSDFASGGFIDLSINYRVSCNLENAEQVVLALHSDSPLEKLEQTIKGWIYQHTQGKTHLYVSDINACFSRIWKIQEELSQKVMAEIGLNFESIISIVGVSNLRPFTIETNGLSLSISDFSNNRDLDITIDYRATCDSSNINQAVLALYGNVPPITILNERVNRWIKEFSNHKTAQIIDNFDLEIENLRVNLREKAKREVGLNFEARIYSNFHEIHQLDPDRLKPFETKSISVPIRIADYDRELELQFEAILEVDSEHRDRAFNNLGREFLLLNTVEEQIKKYFLKGVNLHKFCTDLQYSVRQELENSLNSVLVEQGRKVAYLSLSSKSIEEIFGRLGLIQFLEIKDYEIECPLQDLKKPIRVNNSISLQLVDLSRYQTAIANRLIPLDEYHSKPSIEKWIKIRLEQEINNILPNETFSELLLEFEPIVSEELKDKGKIIITDKATNEVSKYSQKILNALESASRAIGYTITRLISEPELDVRERLALDRYEFLEINDYPISCTVKGYATPIQVKNTLHLQIIDVWKYSNAVKTKQIPLDDAEGKPDLEKWAKQQLEKIVKPLLLEQELIDLLPGESGDIYTTKILTEIKKATEAIGYEVTQIISIPEVDVRDILALKDFLEVNDYSISCIVKGYATPIQVKNTLHLQIVDIRKYGNAVKTKQIPLNKEDEKPDLEQWAKQKLEEIVKTLLLQKEYVDLLPEDGTEKDGTEKYSSDVSLNISVLAQEIGYKVTQILSIPELEKIKILRENFSVKTGEQEYATKDLNCPVKLDTVVVMRIKNLKKIGNRLRNSETPLDKQINNKIYEAISRVMDGIDPERFFMGFEPFDAKERGETKSVKEELKEAIKKELEEPFQAEIISITLKIVDTDLMILGRSLQGYENANFEFDFQPTSGGVKKVTFKGKFQVLSVGKSDWNKFQFKFRNALRKRKDILDAIRELEKQRIALEKNTMSRPNEIETLKEKIKNLEAEACGINLIRQNIESDFIRIVRRYKADEFRYSRMEDLNRLENDLNQWLKEGRGSIKDLYGLEVEVSQLDCPVTESEEIIADKQHSIEMLRRRRKLKEKQLESLESKLLMLTEQVEQPGVDDQINTIETHMDKLYGDIKNLSNKLEQKKKVKGSLEPQKTSTPLLGNLPAKRNVWEDDEKIDSQNQSKTTSHSSSQDEKAESSFKIVDVDIVNDNNE